MSTYNFPDDPNPGLIEPQWLDALRSRSQEESEEAYKLLRRRAQTRLRARFRGALSREDFDDIFSSALADTLPSLLDADVPAEEFSRELERALEKHKKRSKRERLLAAHGPSLSLNDHEDFWRIREQLVDLERVIVEIEDSLNEALDALGERDRSILIQDYRLEAARQGSRIDAPSFPTEAARRKALARARRRFNEELEKRISLQLQDAGARREVLEAALSVVRGGELSSALSLA